MPRKAREKSHTGIYHIMLRGVNRQTLFEEIGDKRKFLETLRKYKDICRYELYSYCLMDNHVHLLIKEVEESISQSVKRICSSYVYWYNLKYERCGHLFQERFRSETVESATYFLTVLRYIHQNPLKAGLSPNVIESEWTSIHEYRKKSDFIDTTFALNLFSNDRKKAIGLFMEFMQQTNDDECLDEQIRVKRTDSEIKEYLASNGVPNPSQLQQMDKGRRDSILASLKELEGISLGQLSRITGVSKSVIQRAR